MSFAYLRLLIFLLTILIPAWASPSLAFCMMYSAYKLNKQGDNIQPWRTPFPIWKLSVVPCPVLNVASWPAHRFFRRQVRSLLKLKSIESMMPSSHLILCCPLLFLPSILARVRVFSNDLAVWIRWSNYWSFSSGKLRANGGSGGISVLLRGTPVPPGRNKTLPGTHRWVDLGTFGFHM